MQLIDTETGEIINVTRLQNYQYRVQRRNRTKPQMRQSAHWPKAVTALMGCLVLAVGLVAVAVKY